MNFEETIKNLPEDIAKLNDFDKLSELWLALKNHESQVTGLRRQVEDRFSALSNLNEEFEGTQKLIETDFYQVKVTGRINRKVDSELVQDIAAEHGLQDHLGTLFRWKPEINLKVWKSTNTKITEPLTMAITSKPGRPSYTITIKGA